MWWGREDQDQGVGRVWLGNVNEVGVATSVSAEQKFMSRRAKRALGDGSGGDGSVTSLEMKG